MQDYIDSGRLLLDSLLDAARPHADNQTILWASLVLSILVSFALLNRSSPEPEHCCVTKLMQNRKASKIIADGGIPSSFDGGGGPTNLDAFIRDVQDQLASIRNEIQILKHEREIVDNELIETSTQILQSIGATFGSLEEEETELELPKIVKPIPNRPNVARPVIDLTPAKQKSPVLAMQPDSPVINQMPISTNKALVSTSPVSQVPQAFAKPALVPSAPQSKAAPARMPETSPVAQPKQPARTLPEPPNLTEPPLKAAPKMSAIAAARLKREQDLAEAKASPPAPVGATNPFGKPKSGPFGGTNIAKLSPNAS